LQYHHESVVTCYTYLCSLNVGDRSSESRELRDKTFDTIVAGLACGIFPRYLDRVAAGQVEKQLLSMEDAKQLVELKEKMIAYVKKFHGENI